MRTHSNAESKPVLTHAEPKISEFDFSQLIEKYPKLVRDELDFRDCPDEELVECWFYEFKRESAHARQVILAWRKTCNTKTFDEFLWSIHATLTTISLRGRLYPLCPEWPERSFLSIPPAERKRRLKLLLPDETEPRAAELTFPLAVPGELSRVEVDFILELLNEREPVEEFSLPSDWQRKSDREVLREVAGWLKSKRKRKPKANVSRRYLCADLKALGAHRILKATGGDLRHAPLIYRDQSRWIKANARAKGLIERIDALNPL